MAILNLTTDVFPYLKRAADDSYNTVATIHDSVEEFVKTYCNRTFEAATYSEVYDHYNGGTVTLNNFPLNYITRIAMGTATVMRVKNTNTYSVATVIVNTDDVTLIYNATTATVDFATYTTINDIVTQVNTLGNGWVATLEHSDMTGVLSTELIRSYGDDARDSNDIGLKIIGQSVGYDVINGKAGIIHPCSANTIDTAHDHRDYSGDTLLFIDYNSGYTTATLPDDLKQAMLSLINYWYIKHIENTTGIKSFRINDYAVSYGGDGVLDTTGLPDDVAVVFDKYRDLGV